MDTKKYTCISCRVAFVDAENQRNHYKTDWHRYNLKRKVADFPPVTAEEFQRRVILQREKDEAEKQNTTFYCKVCRKMFNTEKAFENHLKSKKHNSLLNEQKLDVSDEHLYKVEVTSHSEETSRKENESKDEAMTDDDSDTEEVDSDEWDEEYSDNNPILQNNCLFCNNHSATMTKNVKHMTVAHSFFIPDVEYVVDVKGLLCYLGEKVCQGFMCLWCNDKGKAFYSAEAAQQHMIDKGHCKMLHEGEALLEYADYYDYSSSYPDDMETEGGQNDDVEIPVLEECDYQLVLPSGTTIGHRSLMRYYRQNLNPNQAVVPLQKKIHRVIAQYRALGWKETDKLAAAKKAKDIKYMQQVQSKYRMKLGVKANKLSVKRPQVNF